ncbi:MAG TPA: hypothetical protein VGN98_18690 [Tianweitania sediminis]|jgi:hypothetical protein|nr:hypothetical protein [Tianweitania sediminis]
MAFHVRDPETDRLVRELAAKGNDFAQLTSIALSCPPASNPL